MIIRKLSEMFQILRTLSLALTDLIFDLFRIYKEFTVRERRFNGTDIISMIKYCIIDVTTL